MELFYIICFWFCFVMLVYIYIGYPILLFIISYIFPNRHQPDEGYIPTVTLLFSARNEQDALPAKLESIEKLNYPKDKLQVLAVSDGSIDRTDQLLNEAPFVDALILETNVGKNAALNALHSKATGDVLFYTDANTLLHPDSVKQAAKHFSNPQTGMVVGQLVFSQDKEWNPVGRGTGLYWRYENTLKRAESRLGAVLVGGGSLLVVRRGLIDTLDPRIANDLEIPARIGAMGYNILFEENCLGFEKPHTNVKEEIQRTSRIVARGFRGFTKLFFVMLKNPFRFWNFISHKFLRWFTLPFGLVMLMSAGFIRDQVFPGFVFYLGLITLILAMFGIGMLHKKNTPPWMRPLTLLAQFLVMHLAAFWGILLTLVGKTPATWTVPKSTRK